MMTNGEERLIGDSITSSSRDCSFQFYELQVQFDRGFNRRCDLASVFQRIETTNVKDFMTSDIGQFVLGT